MIRKLTATALASLLLATGGAFAGEDLHTKDVAFSFEGPFGVFDKAQLQRGLQVYTEVCAACHGLKFVPIRTIGDPGGPEMPADQVRAYAKQFDVPDTSDEAEPGDTRAANPTDFFPPSQDPKAPDLSLMAKARKGFEGPYGSGMNQLFKGIGGSEHIYSILTGFEDPPACAPEDFDGYYNTAFTVGGVPDECKDDAGHSTVEGTWMAMPPPLAGEDVEFAGGAPNDLDTEAEDVAAFLTWAAEPKMMARKRAGFVGVIMLIVLASLLYVTNKTLWAPVKRKAREEEDKATGA